MYPEYPQNTNQQDLLTRIKENKVQSAVIGGAGFVLLTLIMVILGLIFSSGPPVPSQMYATSEHIKQLHEVTSRQDESLRNEAMLRQNATINIILAGASSDLNNIVTNVYGGAKPAPDVTEMHAESLANIETEFEGAVYDNTPDATYQKVVGAELESLYYQIGTYVTSEQTPPEVDEALLDIMDGIEEVHERLMAIEL